MDARRPPEFTLELSADRSSMKDVIRGTLHVIFFHRYFPTLVPSMQEVLDVTLPHVSVPEIESLVEQKTTTFLRQLDSANVQTSPQYSAKHSANSNVGGRGQLVVQFLEKKRRKGWFVAKADEEQVWENWVLDVLLTSARSEREAAENRRQMERQLQQAAMKIVTAVNAERNHIPPITTTESNPFPYQILVNPKNDGWSHRMGIF